MYEKNEKEFMFGFDGTGQKTFLSFRDTLFQGGDRIVSNSDNILLPTPKKVVQQD